MKLQKVLNFLMVATAFVSSMTIAAEKSVPTTSKSAHPKVVRAYPTSVNSSHKVKAATPTPSRNRSAPKPVTRSAQ